MGTDIDDRAGEARVAHLRHCDQQLPGHKPLMINASSHSFGSTPCVGGGLKGHGFVTLNQSSVSL
jgi:hypothetical protein